MYSQSSSGKKSSAYLPVEVMMEDGSVKKGYARDFTLTGTVTQSFVRENSETGANLGGKTLKFKNNQNDTAAIKIPVAEIKSLVFGDDDSDYTYQLDKKVLKNINKDLSIEPEDRVLMLPLLRKGPINLYGFKNVVCLNGNTNNCKIIGVSTYISKEGEDLALSPMDSDEVGFSTIFNMKNLHEKFYKAYEVIGKDCPTFLKKVDEARKNNFFGTKSYNENKRAVKKQKDFVLKGLQGEERAYKEMEFEEDIHFYLYTKLIKDYENSCNHPYK